MKIIINKIINAAFIVVMLIPIIHSYALSQAEKPRANDYTIELTRSFGKELFDNNGIPYLKPLVESINATSNSRFFNTAYVPKEVEKPYFKFSIHTMVGFVGSDQKSYKPVMPNEPLDYAKLAQYIDFDLANTKNPIKSIKDTAGLLLYAFKVYANRGMETGQIPVPQSASTILGNEKSTFYFPQRVLDSLVRTYPTVPGSNKSLYQMLPDSMQKLIIQTVNQFPNHFDLPEGANINTLIAFVPQLEIGSFWGTELLLRFIPPVNLGTNVGDFAFWGLGIKHSISQYFKPDYAKTNHVTPLSEDEENSDFDMAVQVVYQGTYLHNKIGVTQADMVANANIWDANLQASKRFGDFIIFSGLSYEHIDILSSYTYPLSVEMQYELGLLAKDPATWEILPPNPPRFPGDTKKSVSSLNLSDENYKFIIGAAFELKPLVFFVDFNLSKFNIFSGGVQVNF